MVEIHFDSAFINELSAHLSYREGTSPEVVYKAWEILQTLTNPGLDLKSSYKIYPSELREWMLKNLGKQIDMPEYCPDLRAASPFGFYFLNSADTRQLRKGRLPAYSLSDCLIQFDKLFKAETHNADDFKTWGEVSQRLLPFSSLIITDNYMFSNNGDNIYRCLEAIFKNVGKEGKYYILLQTSTKAGSPLYGLEDDSLKKVLQEKLERITKTFADIGLKSFEVTIVINNQYHDRHIFTNAQVLKSSNSFSTYFNTDATLDIGSTLSVNKGKPLLEKFVKKLNKIKTRLSSRHTIAAGSKEIMPLLQMLPSQH